MNEKIVGGQLITFNPFKLLIQKIQEIFLRNISNDDERDDDEMEYLQFGICDVQVKSPRSEELLFR